jgi:ATP-dependent DNA helicase DinG
MASPFNYRENVLLYTSEAVPYYKAGNYAEKLTDEIERLIRKSNGHAAVLFTSYNSLGLVFSELQKRSLPFPMFKLERSTSNAIERFKQSGNGVLFASGALWEGIDIPGDSLSMLIIVKLPFQVPDPISEYEKSQYADFREYREDVLIPEMLIKLKQGFGRLIRTETDSGVVALLDCRANENGAYRNAVIAALPDCCVTSDISGIEPFLRTRKPAEYFN